MSLIVYKTTTRSKRCQKEFKDFFPSLEIQSNAPEYFSQYSKSTFRLLKQIFYYHQRKRIFTISQQWLATQCGVSREWINKLLKELEACGVIRMWYRHKEKSFYRVSSFFTDKVIASLAPLWRAFPLTMLLSYTAPDQAIQKSSQLLYEEDIYLKPSLTFTLPNERDSLAQAGARTRGGQEGQERTGREEKHKKAEENVMAYLPSQQKQILEVITTLETIEPLFSETIQSIQSLQLTTFGKLKLLAFPDIILRKVEEQGKGFKNARDPYGLFIATAMKLCKEQGIRPDWSWVNKIKLKLNLPEDTPSIIESPRGNSQKGEGNTKKQSRPFSYYVNHNKEIIKEYGSSALQSQPPKMTALEEFEHIRNTDSERFARLDAKAKEFRQLLGLNEDGTFKPGHSPQNAVKILGGLANPPGL